MGGVATHLTAPRWLVITPLTPRTVAGDMSIEAYLLAVGKKMNLPGYGDGSIPAKDGSLYPLHSREDYVLKAFANAAFDGQPLSDATNEEIDLMDLVKGTADFQTAAEWRKVYYLLARGGRFEAYEATFQGDNLKYKIPRTLTFTMNAWL